MHNITGFIPGGGGQCITSHLQDSYLVEGGRTDITFAGFLSF